MQQQQSSGHWLDCSHMDLFLNLDVEEDQQTHPLAPSFSQDGFDSRPQSTLSFPPSVDNEQDNYTLPPTPVDNYLPLTPVNQQPVPLSSSFDENVYLGSETQTDWKDKLDEQHADEDIADIFYCNANQFGIQNVNEEVNAYPSGMHRIESCTSNALSDDTDTSFSQQMSIEENPLLADFEDYNLRYGPQSCSSVQSYENTVEYDSLINQQEEPLSSNWQDSLLNILYQTESQQNTDVKNILAKSYPQLNQLMTKRKQEVGHSCDLPSKKRCLSLGERYNRQANEKNLESTTAPEGDQTATSSVQHSLEGMEDIPFSLGNHSFLPRSNNINDFFVEPSQSSTQSTINLHQAPCRMRHNSLPDNMLRTHSGNFFESSFNNAPLLTNTMTSDVNGNFPEPHNNLQNEVSNNGISDQCSSYVKAEQKYDSASTESLAADRFHCQNANKFDINLQNYLQFNEACPSTANPSSVPFLPVSVNNRCNTDDFVETISPSPQPVTHCVDSSNNPSEELCGQFFIQTPNPGEMQSDIIPAIPSSCETQFTNQAQTTNQTNHLQSNASFSSLHPNTNNSSTEDAFVPDSHYCLEDLSQYLNDTTNNNNNDKFINSDYTTDNSDLLVNYEEPQHQNSVHAQLHHDTDTSQSKSPELIVQECGQTSKEAAMLCTSDHIQLGSTPSLPSTRTRSESLDLLKNVDPGVKDAFLKGVETGQITPLVKIELKMRILSRRNKEGKEDIDITYVPPKQNELTEEEKKKKKHRQNLNKIAAAKHRQTKKNKQESLEEECMLLEEKNTKLEEKVKEIETEIEMMKNNLVRCGFKVIVTH